MLGILVVSFVVEKITILEIVAKEMPSILKGLIVEKVNLCSW